MRDLGALLVSIVLVFNSGLCADHPELASGSKEFAHMKTLVGTWKGVKIGATEEPVEVRYALTSGGSALVETIFPGTPHEMVSVYHDRGTKLGMTHYCMMGNQPSMALKSASEHFVELDYVDTPGIDPLKDPHMHALKLTFADPNHLSQSWKFFRNGKESETANFKLERVR